MMASEPDPESDHDACSSNSQDTRPSCNSSRRSRKDDDSGRKAGKGHGNKRPKRSKSHGSVTSRTKHDSGDQKQMDVEEDSSWTIQQSKPDISGKKYKYTPHGKVWKNTPYFISAPEYISLTG